MLAAPLPSKAVVYHRIPVGAPFGQPPLHMRSFSVARMSGSKRKIGRTGTPDARAWLGVACSSKRKSRRSPHKPTYSSFR